MAIGMSNGILRPITQIKGIINDMSQGIISKREEETATDELGQMLQAINNLSQKTMDTALFAQQIGQRNFQLPFAPLSERDVLGKALLSMRDNLQASEMELQKNANDLHKKDDLLQAVASATHELISNNDQPLIKVAN